MQPQPPTWLDWLFHHPPLFVVLLAATWALTLQVLGMMSGWAILSKPFRFAGSFYGEAWPFRSARMRFLVHYGNCVTVGVDESGLYPAVFPIFRVGHPPLLIPWSEVSSGERNLIFKKRELRLGHQESIPLCISVSLVGTLRRSAGDVWPLESIAV